MLATIPFARWQAYTVNMKMAMIPNKMKLDNPNTNYNLMEIWYFLLFIFSINQLFIEILHREHTCSKFFIRKRCVYTSAGLTMAQVAHLRQGLWARGASQFHINNL